jgi:hypothetical protein
MCPLGWLGFYLGTLSASIALRFTQLLHFHEVTTSLLSISAQNRLSLPKSLPWGSLFALDDPITGKNPVLSKQASQAPASPTPATAAIPTPALTIAPATVRILDVDASVTFPSLAGGHANSLCHRHSGWETR